MVTRCLPSCCAAGGTMASATPFRTSSSAGGARRASGTRCCPSSLCVLAVPASAPRCCVPLAADNGAPPTNAPLRAFLPGARVAQVSAAPPSICRRAPASASANACRRRSSLPALVAYHTGGSRPRPILRGADPCPACATAPPSLCQAAFAPMRLERPCLVSLAPGERDPPLVIAANVSSPPPGKFPETTPTPSLVTAPPISSLPLHAMSAHCMSCSTFSPSSSLTYIPASAPHLGPLVPRPLWPFVHAQPLTPSCHPWPCSPAALRASLPSVLTDPPPFLPIPITVPATSDTAPIPLGQRHAADVSLGVATTPPFPPPAAICHAASGLLLPAFPSPTAPVGRPRLSPGPFPPPLPPAR
ncbi:unnamed protein product [Closterium sp. NIES-64]|nr:unnamed protein product [Closterium sp. NIES-64]